MIKFARIIRIVTVAPVMALGMLLILFLRDPVLFGHPVHFFLSVVFLAVFPLLAYPLQPLIKKYKDKGREGQRTLAIYFAVAGYIGGCISAALLKAPKNVWVIYLSYLFSGILVMLLNKLFHIRASGHACGVTGPFAILICFGQISGYIGIPVLALVWLSSIQMKRHTNRQLMIGSLIPVLSLGIACLICSAVWSSDVCSSDLTVFIIWAGRRRGAADAADPVPEPCPQYAFRAR